MLKDVKILVSTWNVKGVYPAENYGDLLGLNEHPLPDVYFLGFQELAVRPTSAFLEDPWVTKMTELLATHDFVRITYIRLQGILLATFCKRNRISDIQGVETNFTRTGLKGYWGNKGAVSIRFTMCGVSLCVVNSHLAAHDHNIDQRIKEYKTILETQNFQNPLTDSILTHNYTLWLGDLNFRMDDLSSKEIHEIIMKAKASEDKKAKSIAELLTHDQLTKVKNSGQAFTEFTESTPTFLPTYRFIAKTSNYDYVKRKPAYTDRILYRWTAEAYDDLRLDLKQLHYKSHEQYLLSDHKPVTSLFSMKALTTEAYSTLNLIPPVKVIFSPIVNWKIHEDCVAVYSVTSLPFEGMDRDYIDNVSMIPSLSSWDWIGLFKHDFSNLDDYITFMWANSSKPTTAPVTGTQESNSASESDVPLLNGNANYGTDRVGPWFEITFPESSLLVPNKYRLLYFNQLGDVLGVSSPFTVTI